MDSLLLLWLAALALMGSPGPATMSLAAVGAAFGASRAKAYLAGIMAGTFSVLLLIATGITGIILTLPALVWAITAVGIAYILYLAYKIATAPAIATATSTTPAPSFSSGFVLAIANPKAFAAIGAVYSGHYLIADNLLADAGAKIAAISVVIIVVNTCWLFFGSAMSGFLKNPSSARIANRVFALMLVLSVGMALL